MQPLDTEERIGSLIVPDAARQRMTAHQCEVITVGALEACEDKDCERPHVTDSHMCRKNNDCKDSHMRHPCSVVESDWLIVRPRSFLDAGDPTGKRWLVRQRDVLAIVSDDGTPS